MISTQKIADIMGLSNQDGTLNELNKIIINGIPKNCLERTVNHLSSNTKIRKELQNRLVPSSTYNRRKERLNAVESERVARLARIYAEALDVWGNKEDAQQFLFSQHPLLENQTPLDTAFTSLGAMMVEQVLNKMHYGLPV